jgi:cell division protein ZapD
MMRLEDLYRRALFFNAATAPADHHAALLVLFEIADVSSRADLKTDPAELERQRQLLTPLKDNPAIEHEALDALLVDAVDKVSVGCWRRAGKSGRTFATTSGSWRSSSAPLLPGGVSNSICRRFTHWLHLDR